MGLPGQSMVGKVLKCSHISGQWAKRGRSGVDAEDIYKLSSEELTHFVLSPSPCHHILTVSNIY